MALSEVVRDTGLGFTDDPHKMDERELHDLILVEAVSCSSSFSAASSMSATRCVSPLTAAPHPQWCESGSGFSVRSESLPG